MVSLRESRVPIEATRGAGFALDVIAPGYDWSLPTVEAIVYGPRGVELLEMTSTIVDDNLHLVLTGIETNSLEVGAYVWALHVDDNYWIGGRFNLDFPGNDLPPGPVHSVVTIAVGAASVNVEITSSGAPGAPGNGVPPSEISILTKGAVPNGGMEVALNIQAAVTDLESGDGGVVVIPDGTWKVSTTIVVSTSRIRIQLAPGAIIDASDLPASANLFYFEGAIGTTTTCTANVPKMTRTLAVTSTTGFAVGDFISMLSTQDWDITRGVGEYCQSEWNRISRIVDSTHLQLEKMVAYDWDNTAHTVNVRQMVGPEGCGVSGGGTLIGAGTGQFQTAVRFLYCIDSYCHDLRLEHWENVGISFQRSYAFKATRNTILHTDDESEGYGIMSQGSESGIIAHNIGMFNRRSFEANGGENGISRNITIHDNICISDRTTGVGSHAGSDFVTFHHNFMESCGGGIISRGANATITDNEIFNCIDNSTGFSITTPYADITYQDGITVGSEGVGVFLAQIGECVAGIHPTVTGNRIYGANRYAIFLRGCDFVDATVDDNDVEGMIRLGGTAAEFTAYRCSISDNKVVAKTSTGGRDTYGILVAHTHFDMEVERNRVRFAGTTGIMIIGSSTVGAPNIGLHVRENRVYDCSTRGIDVATGFWQKSYIVGNYTDGCPTPIRGAPSFAAHLNPVAWGNHSTNPVTVGGFYGWGTAPPTAGTYPVSAVVWNSGMSPGEPAFWMCTVAGTPGTWQGFGQQGFSTVNGSTSATLTLSALDLDRALMPARATAQSFVIPPASTLGPWPLGLPRSVIAAGAGQITFSGGAGVVINSKGGALKSNGQGSQMWITYAGSDVWWLTGDITT